MTDLSRSFSPHMLHGFAPTIKTLDSSEAALIYGKHKVEMVLHGHGTVLYPGQ